MNDEYEILPHKLLEDLKYDVEALKKKLSEPETAAQELIAEMEDLKSTIKELNNIFKDALIDVKDEDSAKLLASLQNKIETVTTQNETIARGMVAISDRLEDFMKKHQPAFPPKTAPKPFPPLTLKAPPQISPTIAPPPGPPLPPGVPAPPPGIKPRRKGIFH